MQSKMKCCFLTLVGMLTICALTTHADNGRGRHQKLYLVPTPGKVAIDGKFDDWDLSGQIVICVMDETAEMQSAKFAMMYDQDALYLSAIVRDPSPLMNRHDPRVEPDRAWDADVCQIYLCTDPSMGYPVVKSSADGVVPGLMDMYLWHYTDTEQACLAAYSAMKFDPLHPDWDSKGMIPADKFQAVYVKADDGQGYSFEYRIPWEVVGAKRPLKAGDLTAGLVQFCWSEATGLKTAGTSAWAYDVMSRWGFPWQDSGCWGKFIFSEKGNLPKELVEEGLPPAKPLPLTYEYKLPEESEATIQFFKPDGELARTLVGSGERRAGKNVERWDGLDVHGNPLEAGKYVVKGLYHQPITTKFLFSAHNSGQPPYHTDDRTGSWGGDHGMPTTACAVGDDMILAWSISEAAYGTIRTDLKGKKRWSSIHNAVDIATDGKRLFVAGDLGYEGGNYVKVFDAGDSRPLSWGNGQATLEPPPATGAATNLANMACGVAYGNGKVYVSWRERNLVGVYDATSGDLKETWNVPTPLRLAVRPDGSVAVISENQVLAFKDGKSSVLIADHVDLVEPHPENAHPFLNIVPHSGIAVAPDGTIYVASSGKLQNVSVFDANAKYLRSIGKPGGRPALGRFDKTGMYEPGGITLDKEGRLWVAETQDYPKRHSVWDTKTGELVNEFFGSAGYFGWAYMDPRRPDELYCHNTIWKVDWKNNTCYPYSTIWRPTAPNMIGNVDPNGYGGALRVVSMKDGKQFAHGQGRFQYFLSIREGDIFKPIATYIDVRRTGAWAIGPQYDILKDETKYPDAKYWWKDANNDQTIQHEELSTTNLVWDATWKELWDKVSDPAEQMGREFAIDWSKGNHDFIRYESGENPDAKKLRWAYRGCISWHNAINLPPIRAGNMNGLTMPLGVADGFTGCVSYYGVANILTIDGVYVAQIFRDGRLGGGVGPDTLCSETIEGQLIRPDGMNRYFFIGGAADGRVTEIFGLDTVKRLPDAEYEHSEHSLALVKKAQADYQQELAKSQRLAITRGQASLSSAKPVQKYVDIGRSFTACAAYDEKNLYVAFDVTSPFDLVNTASDPRTIFKGGNLLDIQFAGDPAADPKRKTPVPGDVRLLVTRQAEKPVAVIYRPKVKGFTGQPIVLSSPANKESFDIIETTDKVGLQYAKTQSGFTATVTIPLELIGWTPKPGQNVQLDFGYIFGNAAGSEASLRAYWTNKGFSAGVLHDTPNESRLEPAEWGTATVE